MDMTESVIRRMTRLAVEHDAVHLSQGFTDEPPVFELVWAAVTAMLVPVAVVLLPAVVSAQVAVATPQGQTAEADFRTN